MGFLPSASVPDSDYLLGRSTTEAALAASARTEKAAAAHHRIANCYLAKLFGGHGGSFHTGEATAQATGTGSDAVGPAGLRFADLTSVPENDELTRILRRLS